ncbi:MAG: extracellular solute-binding protein [Alphaproteobacteria bacterium]|nr:extracellular solute-binding protein [Alphaproteobacteria bacterium]
MKLHVTISTLALGFAALAALGSGAGQPAAAADLPKATQAILQKLKLDPSILGDVERETTVPAAWIEGAKKEGDLRIGATWDELQFEELIKPFKERYPFVKIKYARATRHDRVIKPLMAFQSGRVITDVISGIGAKVAVFRKLKALEKISGIPNWNNVPAGMKDPKGEWVGQRLRYWCMAYNTDRVDKKDLPKNWEDLITNSRWHNKKIGMGNRPNLWLITLWGPKGEAWVKDYARNIFSIVKPQLRKEGMNALIGLAIAGEFDASLPSAAYRVQQQMKKGAPVGWHCPEPVPMAISEMAVMKGTKKKNSALMFVNWFLSREGQISQYAANFAPPVHKDLQRKEFLSFPEQIVGKKIAFRDPESLEQDLNNLVKFWDPLWFAGRGLKLSTVSTTIAAVKRGGRRLSFKVGGETHTVKVSGSRTKITVAGVDATRRAVKKGMSCDITYPGNKEEAKKIDCK